jgi:hypothetical protein
MIIIDETSIKILDATRSGEVNEISNLVAADAASAVASLANQAASHSTIHQEHLHQLTNVFVALREGTSAVFVKVNPELKEFQTPIQAHIRQVYDIFATPDILTRVCIILPIGADLPVESYHSWIQTKLMNLSGSTIARDIPIFTLQFPGITNETPDSVRFREWLNTSQPLMPFNHLVKSPEKVEEDYDTRVFVDYRYEGLSNDQYRFAIYEDRVRQMITPMDGSPVRFGEWRVIRRWDEPAGHQTIVIHSKQRLNEGRKVDHHDRHALFGKASGPHTHWVLYRYYWT